MDINYAVLMPPPKRSAKKLQMAILGGVGFVALTAIIVAIVLVKAYSPEAPPLETQVPTPTLAAVAPAPAVTPTVAAAPTPAAAPAAADQVKDDRPAKVSRRRAGRGGRRARAGRAQKASSSSAAKPKKGGDDELKKLLGI